MLPCIHVFLASAIVQMKDYKILYSVEHFSSLHVGRYEQLNFDTLVIELLLLILNLQVFKDLINKLFVS